MWADMGKGVQRWAKVGSSGYVRLIRQGWVTYLAGVRVSAGLGMGVDGCRGIWADMGDGGLR